MAQSKSAWRTRLRRKVLRLTSSEKKRFGAVIRSRLDRLIRVLHPRRLFAFASLSSEPDLRPLYKKWMARRIQLAFPRVRGRSIQFHPISSTADLRPGAFNILEPSAARKIIRPSRHDIVLIPCVGLNTLGYRLGHGGGFYDRYLRQNPESKCIALLFHCQIDRKISHDRHDASVQFAVTEKGLFGFLIR